LRANEPAPNIAQLIGLVMWHLSKFTPYKRKRRQPFGQRLYNCSLSSGGQHAFFTGEGLHFCLQLFKRAHFDLADPFAADRILPTQVF
jgi:hypothetical protein